MRSTLNALLKRRGLKIFVDSKAFLRGLREHQPFAAARRLAQYVLIDNRRVPVGPDGRDVLAKLERLHHVRDGLGYTHPGRHALPVAG
ncbi:MAG: hypothetical protein V4510_01265 [bacterium]